MPSNRLLGAPLPTPGGKTLALAFAQDGRTLCAAGAHFPVRAADGLVRAAVAATPDSAARHGT